MVNVRDGQGLASISRTRMIVCFLFLLSFSLFSKRRKNMKSKIFVTVKWKLIYRSPFLFAFLESPMSLYLNAVFLEDKLILSFNVVKQAERSCLHPSFVLRQRK